MRVAQAPIPLVDLAAQHSALRDEIGQAMDEVFRTTSFVGGPAVKAFEDAYAEFTGVRHVIGVANGTDAIELIVRALEIGHGDEVIVPAHTFIASAAGVARAGARPVLADVEPDSLLLDPEQVRRRITDRTRAIMPVHLYGQAARVEALRTDGVAIIEDAAQAQGARRNGVSAGRLGRAAATSFYPGKNLGAYGDAGAIMTEDDALAARLRALANHGSEKKYEHPLLGFNSRLDSIQAAVLLTKLRRLTAWNDARRAAATRYDTLLAGIDEVVRPVTLEGNDHVWHLYVIRVPERDRVLAELQRAGIGAAIHYPKPVHLHGAFAHLGHGPGDFPVAERAASEVLSLPLYPEITAEQQEAVVKELRHALIR